MMKFIHWLIHSFICTQTHTHTQAVAVVTWPAPRCTETWATPVPGCRPDPWRLRAGPCPQRSPGICWCSVAQTRTLDCTKNLRGVRKDRARCCYTKGQDWGFKIMISKHLHMFWCEIFQSSIWLRHGPWPTAGSVWGFGVCGMTDTNVQVDGCKDADFPGPDHWLALRSLCVEVGFWHAWLWPRWRL